MKRVSKILIVVAAVFSLGLVAQPAKNLSITSFGTH